jgi:hypothetical protein
MSNTLLVLSDLRFMCLDLEFKPPILVSRIKVSPSHLLIFDQFDFFTRDRQLPHFHILHA